MVPVFTRKRLISLASSYAPAASPRLRRRPSSQPPYRHAKPATKSTIHTGRSCTASRPISAKFEPVPRLLSFTTGSSRIPSDLARRTQPVWQYQALPALSALLPTLPGVSRIKLRSAPTRLLRQLSEKAFHLLQLRAPYGALRFVNEPSIPGGVPAGACRINQQRGEPLHPAVDGHLVNLDAPLG
jgi:hypothetical protein